MPKMVSDAIPFNHSMLLMMQSASSMQLKKVNNNDGKYFSLNRCVLFSSAT